MWSGERKDGGKEGGRGGRQVKSLKGSRERGKPAKCTGEKERNGGEII